MRLRKILRILVPPAVLAAVGFGAYLTREQWMPLLKPKPVEAAATEGVPPPVQEPKVLKLSPQARKNLGL